MNQQAQVSSTDGLLRFRAALIEYQEQIRSALGDCQSDAQRTLSWIEQEQIPYWNNQIKKRKEKVELAKQAVNKKKLYESPGGGKQSAIEEEKALKAAQRKLEVAEEKLAACKRWRRQVDRAMVQYQPMIQRLGQTVEQTVPRAVSDLERAIQALEQYRAVQTVSSGEPEGAAAEAGMSRGQAGDGPWQPEGGALAEATPGPGERVAGTWVQGDEDVPVPEVEELDERLVQAVAGHVSRRTLPGAEQWVSVGTQAGDARWYLHRMAAADEADSGWYLGPADVEGDVEGDGSAAGRQLRRCRVDALLRAQHRVEPLLGLPAGWVIAFEDGRALAVFDEQGQLQWPGQIGGQA